MKDEEKTKKQLIEEITLLKKQIRDNTTQDAVSRFEAVIDNTPIVAVQGFDRDGVIYHWNNASKYLYGYDAKEAIGKRMQDVIFSPDEARIFENIVREICETGKPGPCMVWELKTRAGDHKWAYSSIFPVFEHGKVAEIFCMDVDITDRKIIEESLRKNEEHLRTLINAMPDIVCFKDGEGRWLEANDFDLKLFELENVDYKGKKDSELAEYSDFYREAFLTCEESDEIAWRKRTISHNEEDIPKPDGTIMTFDTIKVPLFFPDGRRKGLVVIGRDITERKLAEEKLKRSYDELEKMVEERTGELSNAKNTLQAILDTVPTGVMMAEKDPERITYCSPNVINIFGRDVTKPYTSIFTQELQPILRSLLDGTQVNNFETVIRREDGKEAIILISSAPVKDTRGNITAAVASITDVTGLRQADIALKKNEEFLKNVFEGIQDGISVLDKDMNIIRVNHAMEKWYPHMVPLAGKKCYHAYHKRTAPCEKCPTIRAMRTKTIQSELVPIINNDGSKGWLELYSFPLIDKEGNVTGIIEHVRDITDRKRTEEALRESEERFRVLAETSPATIMVYQGDKFVYVNPRAEKITGYSKSEYLNMNFWEWAHPDYMEIIRERGYARQRGADVPKQYEIKYITKNGEERWAVINGGQIVYNGKPAGIVMAFDITERKLAEERLQAAKSDADLYLDLMGHDLNNMHQVALGFLELAHNILIFDGVLKEDNISLIERPIETLKNGACIIDNVIKLKQVKAGELKYKAVDVDKMLENVKERYKSIPGKDVNISYDKKTSCTVMANELLEDVLSNIVLNSIKHTSGHAEILIDVSKTLKDGKEHCSISIEDNGPGVPDELKDMIFTRFHRGKTKASGKGLGLFLVKTLVEDFKGSVLVEDRVPGDHTKGAKFVVMLPSLPRYE